MRTALRSFALAGVAAAAIAGVTAPSASADPSNWCTYFADCNSVGGHIAPSTVISRAMIWANKHVVYSKTSHTNLTGQDLSQSWRQDCSGLVSMAWRLPGTSANNYGRTTDTLRDISFEISYTALLKGDILDDPVGHDGYDAHVIIFDGWVSSVGGDFYMIEENAYYNAIKHKASDVTYLRVEGIKGRSGDGGDAFIPRRYNKITAQ